MADKLRLREPRRLRDALRLRESGALGQRRASQDQAAPNGRLGAISAPVRVSTRPSLVKRGPGRLRDPTYRSVEIGSPGASPAPGSSPRAARQNLATSVN